ncbi:hypothetical protein HMI54_014146, partial [Coelomomyces lativittatus]
FYVSPNNPLTSRTFDYEKAQWVSSSNDNNLNQYLYKVRKYLVDVLDLWEMENKKPPFFFERSLHPQVYMKPEFRPMYNRSIEGWARTGMSNTPRHSKVPISDEMNNVPYSSIMSISNFQLFDFHHLAFLLGHELMHSFGVDHDEENVHCKGTLGAMRQNGYWDWK